jgi:sterol desaturase/sphingolipid hydroxylase (fatty acid hydroxylase superfamily)
MVAHEKPALITDAEPSHHDQLRTRQIRYGVMMGVRALLLIVATVLVMVEVPLLWLWLTGCAIGMIFLPWVAVLVANDRLPKEKQRAARRGKPVAAAAVPLTADKPRVIDVDS